MKVISYFLFLLSMIIVYSSLSTEAAPDSTTRATNALDGLVDYFWQHDPKAKHIGFFFACGQIGGWGGNARGWDTCSCNTRAVCTDCYRWWDAVALETVASYGIYTNTKRNWTFAETIFDHSPYNDKWNATSGCTFIDDFLWYGIAYLRVYEWLKDPKWLNRSVGLYEWAWRYGWDDDCGGVWWNNCDVQMFKDSITIVQLLHLSSKLAYMFPKNISYLTKAEKIWNWFFSFDDGYGLMSDKYLVSTGAVPEKCCNATTDSSTDPYAKCYNSKISGTSYNQGLLMSSSAYLYLRTGNKDYLTVGLRALDAILTNYTTKDGVLIDEPRSYQNYQYQCWGSTSDPGGDWYSFQGIFMLHLGYFTELLKDTDALLDDVFNSIKTLVEKTSDGAWSKSIRWPPFNVSTPDDACNTGPQTLSHPKFHWWWNDNTTKQIIPPDPRVYFHKTELRCFTVNGNDTQIWEGLTNDETLCMENCTKYSNCSKYLFSTSELYPNTDCWIWSYNRSNHLCTQDDYNFNVGIKRPVGATCSGHCGKSTPLKTATGGVCYCDTECSKYYDCCLDYADYCLPEDYVPSCKGKCSKTVGQPIKGGGYCWCMVGCNPWYTDNNSDGSCCPDYNTLCSHSKVPPCIDARSQDSAVNLFLAHMVIDSKDKNRNL